MRYMVLKHTKPEYERANLWFVADMTHPEHLPRIILKPLGEAADFCERLNKGEKFMNCHGLHADDFIKRPVRALDLG